MTCTLTLYEIVYGPRVTAADDDFLHLLDRALEANTAMARSAALVGNRREEARCHREINKLLAIREAEGAN
nr:MULTISPECIES: hypothetical protein [Streptomyces]